MYLAGNQFMVMENLITDFQTKNPDIKSIYVETIPPGQILKQQLLQQGQINGQDTARNPDLYDKVTNDARCKSCWAVKGKTWFTARHHRETPHRIENGEADVGIVWTTEVVHGRKSGRKIDGVAIPAPYNMQDKVGYAIGSLRTGRNQENANRFLAYLATEDAQNIYAKHGFLRATAAELELRPVPPQ